MYKLFVVLLLLSGCAAPGTKFTQPENPTENEALVYVYRPASPSPRQPSVSVNGKRLASLKNQSYIAIHLPAGKYQFTANWAWNALSRIPKTKASFDAGRRYFVRVTPPRVFALGQPAYDMGLNIVDEADALPELADCNSLAGFDQSEMDIQPLK